MSRKARATNPSSLKRSKPLPSSDDDTDEGCSDTHLPGNVTHYSPISNATQRLSPVSTPIADFHFDTDESDSEELYVPLITDVRTVTKASSPICISDTDTNQSFNTDPPPMKKLRITLDPPMKVEAPPCLPPDQPTTSTNEPRSTMAHIEAVWEARMDSHLKDTLAKHDAEITKKLDIQNKNLASQSSSLEMFLGSRFDELETALKAKVESLVTPKTDAMESFVNTKIDVLESFVNTKIDVLEAFVSTKMGDMESYVNTKLDANDSAMTAQIEAVETRLTAMVNRHLSDLDSDLDFGQ